MATRTIPARSQILKSTVACCKFALIALLFVPAMLASKYLPKEIKKPPSRTTTHVADVPWAKELVRIYAILKSPPLGISDSLARRISQTIVEESLDRGFDPILVVALIDVESKFQHSAVSPDGARGLMQVQPRVGEAYFQAIGLARSSPHNVFRPELLDDPVFNIKAGVHYLQCLVKMFDSINLALTAYNIGPSKIRSRLANDIELSEEYADRVLLAYQVYSGSQRSTF